MSSNVKSTFVKLSQKVKYYSCSIFRSYEKTIFSAFENFCREFDQKVSCNLCRKTAIMELYEVKLFDHVFRYWWHEYPKLSPISTTHNLYFRSLFSGHCRIYSWRKSWYLARRSVQKSSQYTNSFSNRFSKRIHLKLEFGIEMRLFKWYTMVWYSLLDQYSTLCSS